MVPAPLAARSESQNGIGFPFGYTLWPQKRGPSKRDTPHMARVKIKTTKKSQALVHVSISQGTIYLVLTHRRMWSQQNKAFAVFRATAWQNPIALSKSLEEKGHKSRHFSSQALGTPPEHPNTRTPPPPGAEVRLVGLAGVHSGVRGLFEIYSLNALLLFFAYNFI